MHEAEVAHGADPSTQPVCNETNVTDSGVNEAGTGPPGGAGDTAAGDGAMLAEAMAGDEEFGGEPEVCVPDELHPDRSTTRAAPAPAAHLVGLTVITEISSRL